MMPLILNLDLIMKERGITLYELADMVGITQANLSHIKTGKIKAIRFSTLERICDILDCQPGDLIEFVRDEKNNLSSDDGDREGASS